MTEGATNDRLQRAWASGFGTILIALVLLPLATNADSFPLSNYPMFSNHRENASARVTHVVGRSRTGNHRPVPPRMLDTPEIMQAHQSAVVAAKNPIAAELLCARVAVNVAEAGDAWSDIDRLELRADRYDAVAYWQGDRAPTRSRVFASCPVLRESER